MSDQNEATEYSEGLVEFDIWQYLLVLKRNWLPAWLTFFTCLGLAAFAAVSTNKPVYQATGKLLFQGQDPSSELTGVDVDLGELESIGRSNPLETQANILLSRALLGDVIQELDLKDDLGTFLDPDILKKGLTVKQVPNTDILTISYQSSEQALPAILVNELMRSYVAFNTEIQQSEALTAQKFIEDQLPRLEEEAELASRALQDFKTRNQILSLDAEAKEIAALIADLNLKEGEVGLQLSAATARVVDLRRQLAVDADSALALSTLNDSAGVQEVLAQIQAVETELAEQQALYLPEHPTVINLQRRVDRLTSLLEDRVTLVLGSQTQVPQRDLQLGNLQRELISDLVRAESDNLVLQAQLNALNSLKSAYQARADAFPALEKAQRDLEQNLNSAQNRYNQFLERLQELNLAENQLQGSSQVQIIDEAIAPKSSLTSFNEKLLVAGAGAGIFLAIAVAFTLDILNPKVKTVKEIEKLSGYSILGLIPRFDTPRLDPFNGRNGSDAPATLQTLSANSPRIVAFSGQPDEAYQAYHRLQASLRVANLQKAPRVLAITSTSPSEGKSELAANLAAIMAQSGRRVLLLDADLRASTQHKYWNLNNKVGITHLLSGAPETAMDIGAVCHSITENLDVVTAGLAIADPLMLLESSRMSLLAQTASQDYDYVIFDAPPVVPVPDILILGKSCEGIMFVARPKHVDVTGILAAKRLLERSKLPVLGFVATQVEAADVDKQLAISAGGYGYGYGSSYSYRYSYSSDFEEVSEDDDLEVLNGANMANEETDRYDIESRRSTF